MWLASELHKKILKILVIRVRCHDISTRMTQTKTLKMSQADRDVSIWNSHMSQAVLHNSIVTLGKAGSFSQS